MYIITFCQSRRFSASFSADPPHRRQSYSRKDMRLQSKHKSLLRFSSIRATELTRRDAGGITSDTAFIACIRGGPLQIWAEATERRLYALNGSFRGMSSWIETIVQPSLAHEVSFYGLVASRVRRSVDGKQVVVTTCSKKKSRKTLLFPSYTALATSQLYTYNPTHDTVPKFSRNLGRQARQLDSSSSPPPPPPPPHPPRPSPP